MGRNTDKYPNDADLDDLVGFVSPASLDGVARRATTTREDVGDADLTQTEIIRFGEVRIDQAVEAQSPVEPQTEAEAELTHGRIGSTAWARRNATVRQHAEAAAAMQPASIEGASRLYLTYALILMAPPTGGVSGVLALASLLGRPLSEDPLRRSHEIYQKRTLFILLIAAVIGAVLVVVNLGVFVLFLLILWVLARGVSGLMKLKAGKAVHSPRTFWI